MPNEIHYDHRYDGNYDESAERAFDADERFYRDEEREERAGGLFARRDDDAIEGRMSGKIARRLMGAVREADEEFAAAQAGDPSQRSFHFAHAIGALQGTIKLAVIEGGYDPNTVIGGDL